MKLTIRADSVEVEGYVNAVERNSKPLMSRIGRFIERICKGAFKRALKRNDNINILLDHDWSRNLGSTKQGNLRLEEDNIGLHAQATITDPEVVEMARRGDLVGWSFGFKDRDVENRMEQGLPLRLVRDLDLFEVSVLDRRFSPAYEGTLVSTRSVDGEEEIYYRGEPITDEEVETTVEEAEEKADENAEKPVENSAENTAENERSTEVNTEENKSQETKDSNVEKSVEKNDKIRYNKAISIIKTLKED